MADSKRQDKTPSLALLWEARQRFDRIGCRDNRTSDL